MQSLVWFNKEGDNLNFRYNNSLERWEGDLIFHENSNDTFKTIGIYTFEKIPSIEYEVPGILKLDKFQLFNEYRFNFTGNSYMTQSVTSIELVNTDSGFYSKWIHGDNFESKYPIGSQIVFNSPIFEFSNSNQSYTVVQTKKNAILIIGSINNKQFNSSYGSQLGLTSSYNNITISGLNSIGIYNYVNSSLENNLSSWSEPDFYSKYFNGKKLTILNTEKNDGVVTINNIDIFDKIYYRYSLPTSTYTQSDIAIELILKTDLPLIYNDQITLNGTTVSFGAGVPSILGPGVEFIIPSSNVNKNPIVVGSIPSFNGNTNLTYYPLDSQVIWNNSIYQCIQPYTWSATSSINPGSSSYWTNATFIPVTTQLTYESFLKTEVNLTTNRLYFTSSYTHSAATSLAIAAEKHKSSFKYFNIDLYYKDYSLYADLVYPSLYAEVNYYTFTESNNYGTVSITTKSKIYEQNVGILENLKPEISKNINENFTYNIVFTDLDEYGFIIKINGQEYQEQIDWIYVGTNVNLERTIDRTLRNWLVRYYARLISLGIIATLQYTGNGTSIYYNSIKIRSEYPNVPLSFEVEVGSTADFHIPHSEVIFYDMGNYLDININGKSYGQSVTLTGGIPDIQLAISEWVDNYSNELDDYGIYVSHINQMLIFNIKNQNKRLEYTIISGKSNLPGIPQYKIINKISGKFGSLITSNEIILTKDNGTYSFENEQFATGQIVSINNTLRPYDNQEYNILYLGPTDIVLSYQGPFWGTTDPLCNISPYVSIAFNGGFGATGCLPVIIPPVTVGGDFDLLNFTYSFNLYNSSTNTYTLSSMKMSGNSNIKDLIYLQLTSCIYVLGDKITVIDAVLSSIIDTISLPNIVSDSSISIKFNPINNYIYCLSDSYLYIIDPIVNTLINYTSLTYTPKSMEINTSNGDVYVSYINSSTVDIWSASNTTSSYTTTITGFSGNTLEMVFNDSESDMYIIQDNSYLTRIDGSNRSIQTSYSISGLVDFIYYEPINSSIYIFDSNGLLNLNNGTTQSITFVGTSSNNNIIFNFIGGYMLLSQESIINTFELSGTFKSSMLTSDNGHLSISQYDGDVYMASKTGAKIIVIDTKNGGIKHNESLSDFVTKMIFNPDRNSMYGIQPGINEIIEMSVTLGSEITINSPTYSKGLDNNYGTLSDDYKPHSDIWLKTREYIRKPRENYNNEPHSKYVWKWETDEYPQMFLYNFSGDLLPISGSYAYTGEKPLSVISLNKNPNRDISKVSYPEYQQTIFSEIPLTLEHIDSETDLSIVPEPFEVFIGFKSDDEGYITSKLLLVRREDISFTITPNISNNDIIEFKFIKDPNGNYGIISLDINSTSLFTFDNTNIPRGLKSGQIIKLYISDVTNSKNKYISKNHGKSFKIRNVYSRMIIVDFIDMDITNESIEQVDYPKVNTTTYLSVKFKVEDKIIGRFNVSGQTEIEDVRYKIELSNTGQNIGPDDVFIFKPYDINEQGVDWGYLNKKRKEMLMVRNDIFPYVGSYKAIINSINYFGYNDLELYEYYRNININSPDFFKLFKVEIPDIFDNSVEGWTVNDFIKHTMPNPNFEDTNLFNLTYKITDKQGNNTLMYSLSEVILKLQGLKYWLQSKVIPITHKILDITGRADWVNENAITHRNYDSKILNIKQEMTPIDFNINEAYLMPINTGSTVYTCHIDFNSVQGFTAPDYFTIKIKTYKTYKEWNPFTTYDINDRVIYYGKIYESLIPNNKLKNPKKYEDVKKWDENIDYTIGQFSNYDNHIYQYIGTQSSFISYGTSSKITPYYDIITNGSFAKWVDNTDWKNINLVPVQYLTEYRTSTHSYNFTIDSNIDPFITIEVTSDNGYGQIYTSKKNYEIRGLNDLYIGYQGDAITPFEPIIQIKSPFIN